MHVDLFVVRHSCSGAATLLAHHAPKPIHIVNAGDGRHSHPTQALLDMLTIRQYKKDFSSLTVAIVGDMLHSRVARSDITALRKLGAREIRLISPKTLIPTGIETLGVKIFTDMDKGLKDVDIIIMLRLQIERMDGQLIPSRREYFQCYGLTPKRVSLAKSDVLVMHPGPMNRGLEIATSVADGRHSVILPQVSNGIAVRMAVIARIMGSHRKQRRVNQS